MHVLCMVRFRHEKHSGFALTYSGFGGFKMGVVKITTKTFVRSLKSSHRFHKSVPRSDFRLLTCILSLTFSAEYMWEIMMATKHFTVTTWLQKTLSFEAHPLDLL